MGLFSKLKENIEKAKEYEKMVNEKRKAEYEKDLNRPSIANLPFTTLDPKLGEESEMNNITVKYTIKHYGKDIEQFLKCVKEGKAEIAEVVVLFENRKTIHYAQKEREADTVRFYYKIADLNGTVYKENIVSSNDEREAKFETPLKPEEAENPDPVDVNNYPHVFVLHYFLEDEEYYMAVDEEVLHHFSKIIDTMRFSKFSNLYKCLETFNEKNYWAWWK